MQHNAIIIYWKKLLWFSKDMKTFFYRRMNKFKTDNPCKPLTLINVFFHHFLTNYAWKRVILRYKKLLLCGAQPVMPSAHGQICRKELREKVGVKVRFFLGLSQHKQPTFCRKQLREKIRPIFSRTKSQCTRTDFLSELLCVKIAGEVSLLDDVTPIFYWTEVSAHGPIFCRKQLREKIGANLYRSKSQREPIFTPIFLSTIKNRSMCAGH